MAETVNDGVFSPQKLPLARVCYSDRNQHVLQSVLILVEARGIILYLFGLNGNQVMDAHRSKSSQTLCRSGNSLHPPF